MSVFDGDLDVETRGQHPLDAPVCPQQCIGALGYLQVFHEPKGSRQERGREV